MLGFVARTAVRMVALAGLLYVTFFVALGPYTLYGHMRRIADTAEARELFAAAAAEIRAAAGSLGTRIGNLRASHP